MSGRPTQQLSLFDATCIIIGIVIGAGIYETTPVVAASVPGPLWLIGFWLLGGLLSLIGALCYAELTTAYPEEGGDYVFLDRAFGRRMSFLFAWAGFWVVRPANIGAVAFIFARYATNILPLNSGGYDFLIYAVLAVIGLSIANLMGVQSGKWTQNVLTTVKVIGLLMVVAVGLLFTVPAAPAGNGSGSSGSNFYLALILVLFTFGGWNNISYVAAEVKRPEKNILRSLVIGVLLLAGIYILVNLAFMYALGMDGMVASDSVASDVVRLAFGETGGLLISLLICITCLGNINGLLFTESRIYYALGRHNRTYRLLGEWSVRLDSPVWSLTLQAVITLVLIIVLGSDNDAFERLVILSAPLYWFFVLLVGIALFILRRRDSRGPDIYRVPLYPWLPIVFTLSNLFIFYASLSYAWQQRYPEVAWIFIVLVTGIAASYLSAGSKEE